MVPNSGAKNEFKNSYEDMIERELSSVDMLSNEQKLLPKSDLLKSEIQSTLKFFEKVGCNFPIFGNNYERYFYRNLVENELALADLSDDSKILVVGSGPLPMTSIYLAKNGFDVFCIDKDGEAIKSARKKVRQLEADLNIKFKKIDGKFKDYSDFDAVWVPLHVTPRKEVILKILKDLEDRAKVIFRNPRGYLERIYPKVDPYVFDLMFKVKKHPFGKESVLLEKSKGGINSMKKLTKNRDKNIEGDLSHEKDTQGCKNKTLCELQQGERAIILDCPEDPQLNALGLRPGKPIKTESKQPFDGPFLTSIEGRKIALDPDIAKKVACRKA